MFTHVYVLGKASGVLVLRVLPVLLVVRRHHINRVRRLTRVAHVVQLGVVGLLLVRTLQHVVVLIPHQLVIDVN